MYEAYAPIYDRIGQAAWSVRMAAWTLDWLQAHHARVERVADFGCGTGVAARLFAAEGLKVVGVDCSAAMLAQAREQRQPPVEWLLADMREVVLPAPVDLVTAFYDTLNYLTTYADLVATWQRIGAALTVGGYAVVDVNTVAAYVAGWNERDLVIADTDDLFVLHRLHFEAKRRIGSGRVLWFERDGASWQGADEVHEQRAHTDAELRHAIAQAGLTVVDRRTPTGDMPDVDAPRVIYVAQRIS